MLDSRVETEVIFRGSYFLGTIGNISDALLHVHDLILSGILRDAFLEPDRYQVLLSSQ